MTFQDFGLHPDLLRGVKELGFSRPTPIQTDAIPPALEGRDVLACAMTGSGKTAAFLLPVMHRLIGKKRGSTRVLVLTPTRELAAQIEAALNEFAVHTPITAASIIGGLGMGPQEHALRSGVDVIVATPGRLLDHMRRPYARFDALEALVLDEADRMLDMGFLPDIRRIVKTLPAKRQTLFFSATLPAAIQKLASEMLRNPARINLERKSAPAVGITHAVYPVPQALKSKLLVALLEQDDVKSVLVFTRTKHRANRLAQFLERFGLRAGLLHGNRSQAQRTKALAAFKSGKQRVLVATDLAARGIDVEDLSHVINFDVPPAAEDYIHRVGRTGRADAIGDAFTFVAPDEESDLRTIEHALGKRLPRILVPDFDYKAQAPQEERRAPRAPQRHGSSQRSAPGRGRSPSRPPARPRPAAPAYGRGAPAEPSSFGRGVHGAGDAPGRSVRSGPPAAARSGRSGAPSSERAGGSGRGGNAGPRSYGHGAPAGPRSYGKKKSPRYR